MQFNVGIGDSSTMRLQRAVLLYGDNPKRCSFAAVHDVVPRKDDIPTLGQARLLTVEFVRELIKSLGRNHPFEILPENVLFRNDFVTVWWVPAGTRPLFFHEETAAAALSARKFPIPPLVFQAAGHALYVRALAENRRPEASTSLFVAPFWNVYANGSVCQGFMRSPKDNSLASLQAWERAFFGSNFTHTIRDKVCQHPGSAIGMWQELAEKPGPFPVEYLVPLKQTLQDFISHE